MSKSDTPKPKKASGTGTLSSTMNELLKAKKARQNGGATPNGTKAKPALFGADAPAGGNRGGSGGAGGSTARTGSRGRG